MSLTSSYGGGDGVGNCTSASGGDYTANLLADRRYDLAVVCCVVLGASVCLNALLVHALLSRGRGPWLAAGVSRSWLLLSLVAGDCLEAGGGCGVLAAALVAGRWPLGELGCAAYNVSTVLGHVVSYYTLAGFVVDR